MLRVLLALFCLQTLSWACLWDDDTLAAEAEGVPDVIRVIAGRFPRNPPLYYEMRLKRVAPLIEAQPDQLELYDDAGVAADRLHRGDEAIHWMHKKRLQLEKLNAKDLKVREHWYRYHANIGTFYAHHWLREGADRDQISEMKTARDHIARAIEINPDAHFGREKYQLQAMEWIIVPPQVDPKAKELPTFLSTPDVKSAQKAVEGLSGLIVLGDAWQSVDVFYALAKAVKGYEQNPSAYYFNRPRSSLGYFVRLRARELVKEGKTSILPTAPTGTQLQDLLAISPPVDSLTDRIMYRTIKKRPSRNQLDDRLDGNLDDSDKIEAEDRFYQLRSEADEWQRLRTEYMMTRLEAGRHPDTDKTFWKEWAEPPAPDISTLPAIVRSDPSDQLLRYFLVAGVLSFSLAVIAIFSRYKNRKPI